MLITADAMQFEFIMKLNDPIYVVSRDGQDHWFVILKIIAPRSPKFRCKIEDEDTRPNFTKIKIIDKIIRSQKMNARSDKRSS
jgi:hypothetical protein